MGIDNEFENHRDDRDETSGSSSFTSPIGQGEDQPTKPIPFVGEGTNQQEGTNQPSEPSKIGASSQEGPMQPEEPTSPGRVEEESPSGYYVPITGSINAPFSPSYSAESGPSAEAPHVTHGNYGPGAPIPPIPPGEGGASSSGGGQWGGGRARPAQRTFRSLVVVALIAALVGAAVSFGVSKEVASGKSNTVVEVTGGSSGPAMLTESASIPSIIHKVLPAVVSIKAISQSSSTIAPNNFPFNIFPFGGSSTNGSVVEDEGTGMIISPSGEVVTNNHVIAGATSISVTLMGHTHSMPATLIGTDPADDIALLKIKGVSNLPTVTLGNSSTVQVGDAVVAIGNALGLPGGLTVTQGIISAMGRTVQASDPVTGQTETLTDMLQTDAAINSGNSGGPLVNSAGQVIGMNTAVAGSSAGNAPAQNIGFAIPVDRIKSLLPQLLRGGVHQSNAYIGVDIVTLTPQLRQQYGFMPNHGAVIVDVLPGTPASRAGLEVGDIIVSFNGKPVTSASSLVADLANQQPGNRVSIGIYRGIIHKTVTVTLGAKPAP
ncbi:MAG: trypsin-like peptidase domain-containing protein [Actinobacteria bacterium]|nr:trypsin-like peptidase domain-containing protein [Actinomycetota bacterium]MCL6094229.1 trypsin-like peptidase domain-containing protein [Actinomycetota bacterium]